MLSTKDLISADITDASNDGSSNEDVFGKNMPVSEPSKGSGGPALLYPSSFAC